LNERQLRILEAQVRTGPVSAIDVAKLRTNFDATVKPVQDLKVQIEKLPEKRVFRSKLKADALASPMR